MENGVRPPERTERSPAVWSGQGGCQVAHLFHVVSGRMGVRMDDGAEDEYGPGDAGSIPPGHDAWVVGEEPFVAIDFQAGANYASPQG